MPELAAPRDHPAVGWSARKAGHGCVCVEGAFVDAVHRLATFGVQPLENGNGAQTGSDFLNEPEEHDDAGDVRQDRDQDEQLMLLLAAQVCERHNRQAEGEDEDAGRRLQRPAAEGQADQAGSDLTAGELNSKQQGGHSIDDESEHRRGERADDGTSSFEINHLHHVRFHVWHERDDCPA